MSASIREQVAKRCWDDRLNRTYLVPTSLTYDHLRDQHAAKEMSLAVADAALAVVRDAVLAEIDRRMVPVTWDDTAKELARNDALTDLRAAVAELLGA
jgi:hypothetical protein